MGRTDITGSVEQIPPKPPRVLNESMCGKEGVIAEAIVMRSRNGLHHASWSFSQDHNCLT